MSELAPIVYVFCGWPLHHGERGDELDPEHPEACFCGFDYYLACPEYLDGGGIMGWTVFEADGDVHADPPGLR